MVLLPTHGRRGRRRRSRTTVNSEMKQSEEDPTRGPHTCQLCPRAKDARVRLRLLIPLPNRHPSFLGRMAVISFPNALVIVPHNLMGRESSGTCLFLVAHLPRGPAAALTNIASSRMQNVKSCKEFVNNTYLLLPDCVLGCWRRTDGRTHRH